MYAYIQTQTYTHTHPSYQEEEPHLRPEDVVHWWWFFQSNQQNYLPLSEEIKYKINNKHIYIYTNK
jgi:hypothetical protein